MKVSYGLWATIFVLTLLFGGPVIAVVATVLAIGSSVSTGLSVQNRLEGGSRKQPVLMLFVSQMIRDPNERIPNRLGLTIGLTVHTPKYWDCHKYDFLTSQFDEMYDELSEETMERRYQSMLAHRDCTKKHLSYPGYAYWTGPKRRYTFRYMGPVWRDRDVWWKPFSVSEHGRYTRWIAPREPEEPKPELSDGMRRALEYNRRKFAAAMERSREQMNAYIAKREAGE